MAYSITKADPEDNKDAVIALCTKNLSPLSGDRFNWKYIKNPDGKADVWLTHVDNDEVPVGALSVFPRKISVLGQDSLGGILGDYSLSKEHRTLGPALSLQKEIIESFSGLKYNFLYTIPNDKSRLVMRRAGYALIGQNIWLTKPLKSISFVQQRVGNSLLAKVISYPLDILLKIKSKQLIRYTPKGCKFEKLTQFDERFDLFWEKIRSQFPVIENRGSEYMNWRYIENPNRQYNILALTTSDRKEILAYIVSYDRENRTYIADFLFTGPDKNMSNILREFTFCLNKEIEAISLVYFGSAKIVALLKSHNFLITNDKAHLLGYIDDGAVVAETIRDRENWHFIENDEDV
ncbi:MAG: hypothetical protein KZQ99_01860 [Candidatus Thiodiazotropha sp. (ex Dulcina madagascariensis)]|nr:hypothetical protein [Candidatus Thiodiazotropha sp. (ex Dulcina madagascariensis)]